MKTALVFLFLITLTALSGSSNPQNDGLKERARNVNPDNIQPLMLSGQAKLKNNKDFETLIWIPKMLNLREKHLRMLIYLDRKLEISDRNISSETKKIATDAFLIFVEYLKIFVTGKMPVQILSREDLNVTSKRLNPYDYMSPMFLASVENKIKSFRYVTKSKNSVITNYPSSEEDDSDAILEVDVSLSDSEYEAVSGNIEDEEMPLVFISFRELKDNYVPFDPILIDITALIKQTKNINRVGRQSPFTRPRLQTILAQWAAELHESNITGKEINKYLQDKFTVRDLPIITEWLNSNVKNVTKYERNDRRENASDHEVRSKRATINTTEYIEDMTQRSPKNMVTVLPSMPDVIFTKSEISLEKNSKNNSSDSGKSNLESENDRQKTALNIVAITPLTINLHEFLSRRNKGKHGENSRISFESRSPFRAMRDPSEIFQAVARRYGHKPKGV